ncbi:MAG: hypothetical protein M1817_001110 [Caeruleum heppii]|nr:MAG: hypothetical protein M1817_001110 [Caeruleum heppii]
MPKHSSSEVDEMRATLTKLLQANVERDIKDEERDQLIDRLSRREEEQDHLLDLLSEDKITIGRHTLQIMALKKISKQLGRPIPATHDSSRWASFGASLTKKDLAKVGLEPKWAKLLSSKQPAEARNQLCHEDLTELARCLSSDSRAKDRAELQDLFTYVEATLLNLATSFIRYGAFTDGPPATRSQNCAFEGGEPTTPAPPTKEFKVKAKVITKLAYLVNTFFIAASATFLSQITRVYEQQVEAVPTRDTPHSFNKREEVAPIGAIVWVLERSRQPGVGVAGVHDVDLTPVQGPFGLHGGIQGLGLLSADETRRQDFILRTVATVTGPRSQSTGEEKSDAGEHLIEARMTRNEI